MFKSIMVVIAVASFLVVGVIGAIEGVDYAIHHPQWIAWIPALFAGLYITGTTYSPIFLALVGSIAVKSDRKKGFADNASRAYVAGIAMLIVIGVAVTLGIAVIALVVWGIPLLGHGILFPALGFYVLGLAFGVALLAIRIAGTPEKKTAAPH